MPNRHLALLLSLISLGVASRAAPSFAHGGSNSVRLFWTAPGDDGNNGAALLYDVRYSNRPINEGNFDQATRGLIFRASPARTHETCRVTGLLPGEDYFFAVKTVDDHGNWSRISNLAKRTGRLLEIEPIVTDFSIGSPQPNPARGSVQFGLNVPLIGERARVEAFDAAGRHVRSFAVEGGAHDQRLTWDLKNDRGEAVPAGVYILRAQRGTSTYLRRLVVIR
jgi:hypothetical protein